MIPRWGYLVLKSKDNRTIVQIFTDLDTGLILRATVAHRQRPWGRWEPPTEVEKVV